MFELIATGIGTGLGQIMYSAYTGNNFEKNFSFNIGKFRSDVYCNAKLDLARKNLHVTIDIDINL